MTVSSGGFQGHLLDGERVSKDVLGQLLHPGMGFGQDPGAGVDVEAAVFPGHESLGAVCCEELTIDKQLDDLGTEQFLEWFDRCGGKEAEPDGRVFIRCRGGLRLEEAIGYDSMEGRVEIEVFTEGVNGQDDAGEAIGQVEGGAARLPAHRSNLHVATRATDEARSV